MAKQLAPRARNSTRSRAQFASARRVNLLLPFFANLAIFAAIERIVFGVPQALLHAMPATPH